MFNSSSNNVNLDFERTIVYTRKRPDELNYQNSDNNNILNINLNIPKI